MRRRLGRQSPRATALFFAVLAVGFSGLLLLAAHNWERSRDAQRAPTTTALVTSASQQYHSSKGGGYFTSTYRVQGRTGAWTSTVHARGREDRSLVGRWVAVKVDPADPGYAEFPGRPASSVTALIVAAAVAVFSYGATVAWLVVVRRQRRGRLG